MTSLRLDMGHDNAGARVAMAPSIFSKLMIFYSFLERLYIYNCHPMGFSRKNLSPYVEDIKFEQKNLTPWNFQIYMCDPLEFSDFLPCTPWN